MSLVSIGISPCPNDIYMFDALMHQKLPSPYSFSFHLEDIETLNQFAQNHFFSITKLSIFAFFHLIEHYQLFSSGAALGEGCGPLVISKKKSFSKKGKVALPGQLTTANLLFQLAFPKNNYELIYMPFDQIINALLQNEVDMGVIIHESRFNYDSFGLNLCFNLGIWWENETQLPLPLGGIAVSRQFPKNDQLKLQILLKDSIIYAEQNHQDTLNNIYHSYQKLDLDIVEQHIQLYVNEFSKEVGEVGKKAIYLLLEKALHHGLCSQDFKKSSLFVEY